MNKDKNSDESYKPDHLEINLNDYISTEEEQEKSQLENFGINNELWDNKEFLHELQTKGYISLKFTTKKDSNGYPALNISSNIDHPERFGIIPEVNNIYKQTSPETNQNSVKKLEINPYVEVQSDRETGVVRIIVDVPETTSKDIIITKKDKLLVLKAETEKITYYKELIIGQNFITYSWTCNDGLVEIVVTPDY